MGDSLARILVVDDEASVLFTLATVLRRQGYAVSTAVDGIDALHQLHQHTYELLLVDLKLPGGPNGLEIARCVRTEELGIAILILTGSTEAMANLAGEDADGFNYMSKTASPQEVLDRLAALLQERSYLSPIPEPVHAREVVCS